MSEGGEPVTGADACPSPQTDAIDSDEVRLSDDGPSHFAERPQCFRRDDPATGSAIGSPDGGQTF
jgi:hypothetical protein